jgi:WD40 repeat protein
MTDMEVMSLSPVAFQVFDLRQSTLLGTIHGNTNAFYTCFAMSKTTTVVALGRSDGTLELVDWRDTEKSLQIPTTTSLAASSLTCLALSPVNPNLLAASSQDGQLVFLDIRTGGTIQTIQVENAISSISFHVDGILCAVGTETGRVLLYDLRAPEQIVACKDFEEPIVALEFAPRTSSSSSISGMASESFPNATVVDESAVAVPRAQPPAAKVGTDEHHTPSISTTIDKAVFEDIVQDAVDQLRDEMGSTIRNLHVDMLRQFQMQADEFTSLLTTQMTAMEQLMAENEKLRDDNKKLRNKS